MDRQGAINTARGAGYGILYSENPKGYRVIFRYANGSIEEEMFGSYESCMDRMEQIGYEVLERQMGI